MKKLFDFQLESRDTWDNHGIAQITDASQSARHEDCIRVVVRMKDDDLDRPDLVERLRFILTAPQLVNALISVIGEIREGAAYDKRWEDVLNAFNAVVGSADTLSHLVPEPKAANPADARQRWIDEVKPLIDAIAEWEAKHGCATSWIGEEEAEQLANIVGAWSRTHAARILVKVPS